MDDSLILKKIIFMNKFYKKLMVGLTCLLGLNLSAQTFKEIDVITGNNGSYPELLKTIGDRMYFQYEEPTMNDYEAPAYLKQSGEVVKLKWPQGIVSDSYDTEFFDLNGQAIWIQYVYDNNIDEYYRALSIERNDSIVFLTDNNDGDEVEELIVYNNKAYFTYYVDSVGYELFSYDGTTIALALDLYPGMTTSYPGQFLEHNNKLFFNAIMPSGYKVIETDGVTFTELSIPYIYYPINQKYVSSGNDLYYLNDENWPPLLIHYDGTTVDTIYNGINGSSFNINSMMLAGNELYLNGYTGSYIMAKLNTTNDTLVHVATNIESVYTAQSYNDTLFFSGFNMDIFESGLFYLIPGVDTAVTVGQYYVNDIELEDNKLYFTLDDLNIGYEPYVWKNGTAELMVDINSSGYSDPFEYELFNGQLILNAYTDNLGNELVAICISPVTEPTVPSTQVICEDAMVSELSVNGSNILFYESNIAEMAIDPMDGIDNYLTVFVTSNQVCASDRVEVPYTVSLLPQSPVAHLGGGLLKVLTPSSTYQWMDCQTGDSIQGETAQTFQSLQNGVYQCIITNADGCSVLSDCIYVVNLSVTENFVNAVKVYPNPANQFITLEASEAMKSFELVSLAGQLVLSQQANSSIATLSLENTSNGVYILNVYGQTGEQIGIHRIVVNK
jgi:ELWxxDGT repeat protein